MFRNPFDGSTVASVADCAEEDAAEAVEAAAAAFPSWRSVLPRQRSTYLRYSSARQLLLLLSPTMTLGSILSVVNLIQVLFCQEAAFPSWRSVLPHQRSTYLRYCSARQLLLLLFPAGARFCPVSGQPTSGTVLPGSCCCFFPQL